MKSLRGRLLIAAPSLTDPNFARAVVLIAAHGETGALGLILNRELDSDVAEVWARISSEPCVRREKMRHGGPVGGTLMAVHDRRPLANLLVGEDLYVATELGAMESLAASADGRVRFFAGHAGWGPGQLEDELREGSWLVAAAVPDHVFGDHDSQSLWKDAATVAGRREVQSLIEPRHIPEDPRAN
ncbi:YqgE/AlgH family protein [Paludisphaera mucosa]|uniref:YqgE/AlgH family protein n=1 Tax=Paludisphaera mucosa TaxID=3030827 RepID=A0ABT6FBP2_9BACT|nr:YqgE/AlgH family protein [Paludisphaera mucosa]MDG3005010.1 YqgE/AlgH family protein [Paludisphaera mucosa]